MNIKDLRKKYNLTQEDFARKIDVTVSAVNRWEKGKTSPDEYSRLKINNFIKEQENASKSD